MGWFNPAGWLLSGLTHAITAGIAQLAGWMFARLIDALQATTAIRFDTWFAGPWRAMLVVAATVALPLLLFGVLREVLAGNPAGALHRGVFLPLVIGVGLAGARALLGGLLLLVDLACAVLVTVALGGTAGYGRALAHMQTVFGLTGVGITGTPGIVAALLTLVVGVLAFVVWVELAVRAALVYLLAVMVPLAAAGLLFRATAGWTRRLLEVITAVALSKLVITAAMVLAATALSANPSGAGAHVGAVVTGIALLLLGSFALPMTMRLVPHAAEAAVAAGTGAMVVARLRRTAVRMGGMVAGGPVAASATAGAAGASTVSRLSAASSGNGTASSGRGTGGRS